MLFLKKKCATCGDELVKIESGVDNRHRCPNGCGNRSFLLDGKSVSVRYNGKTRTVKPDKLTIRIIVSKNGKIVFNIEGK